MPQVASFPFTFVGKTKMGMIYRPYAVVRVYSVARQKWQPIEMVIDSGADYTLLPKRYGSLLGVDLVKDCVTETTLGIGGAEKVYQYQKLPIMIGDWQAKIPVGFLGRDGIPPLLGRLSCLETLKVVFANRTAIFESAEK